VKLIKASGPFGALPFFLKKKCAIGDKFHSTTLSKDVGMNRKIYSPIRDLVIPPECAYLNVHDNTCPKKENNLAEKIKGTNPLLGEIILNCYGSPST
jgi:hypothetical protein